MTSTEYSKKKIAVLIPCYNEQQTIAKVVSDFRRVLPEADIYVCDNNSTDSTDKAAADAGAIVMYEYKQGKGNAMRTMFRNVDADCYIMVDGDDTCPAEASREMCDHIISGKADMVVGDRLSGTYFTENKRPFHNFGNKLVCFLTNKLFHAHLSDIMCGYRAFSYEFVKTYPVITCGYEIETEMSIHALDKNFLTLEVPFTYRDRPKGSFSKLNTYSDGIKVVRTILRMFREYKPRIYFGIISFILALTSVIFAVPVFAEYFRTGLVLRFPTLIFACFLMLSALLFFCCGIILNVISNKHKQLFEIELNKLHKHN